MHQISILKSSCRSYFRKYQEKKFKIKQTETKRADPEGPSKVERSEMRQSLKKKETCEKVSKEYVGQDSPRKRTRRDRGGDGDESEEGRGRRMGSRACGAGQSKIQRAGRFSG